MLLTYPLFPQIQFSYSNLHSFVDLIEPRRIDLQRKKISYIQLKWNILYIDFAERTQLFIIRSDTH